MTQPPRIIKPYIIGIVIGAVAATWLQQGRVDGYFDYAMRIQEQYRGCAVVGQFPTQADMQAGEGN